MPQPIKVLIIDREPEFASILTERLHSWGFAASAAHGKEEALDALADGDPEVALEKLQHAVATDPANDDARFDYVKLLLQLGRVDDAKVAFAPVIAKTGTVRRFDSLQRWQDAIDFVAAHADGERAAAGFDAKISANKRDFEC